MNSLLLFALLATAAAATVSNQVPEVPDVAEVAKVAEKAEEYEYEIDEYGVPLRIVPESRQSLTVGVIGPDDRLIARITHGVAAAAFLIHDQDVTVHGAPYTNITSVQVTRTGTAQHAIPTIKSGGLGHSFVVVNILGVRGRAFDYTISVYSSIGCPNS